MQGKKIKVGHDGFVMLVDAMGDDQRIVDAARVSYGDGTKKVSTNRGLLRYLMRHRHTSPFEQCELQFLVRVPMDIWRQWVRHRTACLTGDTPLVFNRPCDGKAYRLSVKEIFERFQPSQNTARPDKQRNAYFKRDRVQAMQLRCVNEETGEVLTTNIVDVWESGEKQVFRIAFFDGQKIRSIKTSKDHLFFTPEGWKKLGELSPGDMITTISSRSGIPSPKFNQIDSTLETWAPIVGWEDYYEISDQGRVRRIVGGRGSRSHGRCKKITVSNNGRAVTSLNRPGEQVRILVHREMLKSFVGEPDEGMEACHFDGNSLNNVIENLHWGTRTENADEMVKHGRSTYLHSQAHEIVSISPAGEEMTYDLEVVGPWHNFSANGAVVHNSINEYSTRYSIAIDNVAKTNPREWRLQSKDNKQGSKGYVSNAEGTSLSIHEDEFHEKARDIYQQRLDKGVAREQARKDLPLSTYTEAYWKIDLHNLLHFLSLRMDSHAQKEIRDYANTLAEIVEQLFPLTWEAFKDYRLDSMALSGLDVQAVQRIVRGEGRDVVLADIFSNKREGQECIAKLQRLGICKERLL